MAEKPTKAVITITFDMKSKECKTEGPLNDPVLFFGMLEMARARFITLTTIAEIEQREKLKQRIQVVPAGGLPRN